MNMTNSKQSNVGVKRLTNAANDALYELKKLLINNCDATDILKDGKIIEIALKKYLEELKQKDNRK